MKKMWTVLLGLALLSIAAAAQAQYVYSTNADGASLTITAYNGPGGVLTIPSTISNLTVIDIGTNAFANTAVTVATIPATVTNLDTGAFVLCEKLLSVSIPGSVVNIGESAFQHCTNLTTVTLGYGVANIGKNAFVGCQALANVTIPSSVTNIGDFAFLFCASLTNMTIPSGVTSIGTEAFAVCSNLTNVTIPSSVTNIGTNAFSGSSLTTVTVPEGITSIPDGAFSGTLLTSVTIPSTVTNIGKDAYIVCPALTNITVSAANSFYTSVNGILFDKAQSTLIEYPAGLGGAYTVPSGVTSIAVDAFSGSGVTSVSIPASVSSIGDGAFNVCLNLTNITVSSQNLYYSSLNGVLFDKSQATLIDFPSALTGSYSIPATVQNLGPDAFTSSSLSSVTIDSAVTNIAATAFDECANLRSIFFLGNAPVADPTAFTDTPNATIYYLPGATGWGSTFDGVPAVLAEVITWANPSPIAYGSPLTSLQLNASSDVSGSFVYAPTNGTLLSAGTNALTVIFTPDNTTYYQPVTNTVSQVVLPAPLSITASNASKNYGQTVTFAGTEFAASGLVNGEKITSVTLNSAGAGAAAGVAGSPYPIIPSAAQPPGVAANYVITYNSGELTVNPIGVTIASGITANNKFYDRTTTATLSSNNVVLSGVTAGDIVSLNTNGYTANFVSAAFGNGIAVTVSGLTLSGASAANYSLTQPVGLTANISGPTLKIVSSKPNVVISWPSSATDYALMQTASIAKPVTWSIVTNQITLGGTNNSVIINAGAGVRYYELIGAP